MVGRLTGRLRGVGGTAPAAVICHAVEPVPLGVRWGKSPPPGAAGGPHRRRKSFAVSSLFLNTRTHVLNTGR
eukprot:2564584-Prymnesium_polylepis.1